MHHSDPNTGQGFDGELRTAIAGLSFEYDQPGKDPHFYTAKRTLRRLFPAASMIELLPERVTLVIEGLSITAQI